MSESSALYSAGALPGRVTREEAIAAPHEQLPGPEGARSALLMRHGTMTLRYYAPRGHDPQTPHEQDEIYIVASGTGTFVHGPDRVPFGPGDALSTKPRTAERPRRRGPGRAPLRGLRRRSWPLGRLLGAGGRRGGVGAGAFRAVPGDERRLEVWPGRG